MSDERLDGWTRAPVVGVVVPSEGRPGWTDAAWWLALLEAWGVPTAVTSPRDVAATRWTTLIVPGCADASVAEAVDELDRADIVVCGSDGPAGSDEQRVELEISRAVREVRAWCEDEARRTALKIAIGHAHISQAGRMHEERPDGR